MTNTVRIVALIVAGSLFLVPAAARAQQVAASITGVVRDASGGVLPGVTVEAASPALIDKVRVLVTDNDGRYRFVDLRAGIYSVSFASTVCCRTLWRSTSGTSPVTVIVCSTPPTARSPFTVAVNPPGSSTPGRSSVLNPASEKDTE